MHADTLRTLQAPEMDNVPAHLSASNAQMIEDGFTDTLLFLLEGADACEKGHDERARELDDLLRSHASTHARSIAEQMHRAVPLNVEEGWVDHATPTEAAASDQTSVSAEITAASTSGPTIRVSTFKDAMIKPRGVRADPEDGEEDVSSGGARADVDGRSDAIKSHLHDILHDRCVHVDSGAFWNYQFCYSINLVQFHEDENSLLTIQLGRFSETETSWEVIGEGAEKAIVHDYSKDGAECEENGENRRAVVRFLCDRSLSNSAGIRVEVREPRLCQYQMDVYLSDLCEVLD